MRGLFFGLIDVVRVLGGVLLLNAVMSWWFTGGTTWGYDGKWVDLRFFNHLILGEHHNFTENELKLFDGSGNNAIYVGVNGTIYDVTASLLFYGPKGTYSAFAGRDATRAWATGCLHVPEVFTHDIRGLEEQDFESLRQWVDFFESHRKYWVVGTVTHDKVVGELIPPCERISYWH